VSNTRNVSNDFFDGISKFQNFQEVIAADRFKQFALLFLDLFLVHSDVIAGAGPGIDESLDFELVVDFDDCIRIDLKFKGHFPERHQLVAVFELSGEYGDFDGPLDLLVDGEGGFDIDIEVDGFLFFSHCTINIEQ